MQKLGSGRHLPSSGYLGLITIKTVLWIPGLLIATEIVGQSFIVIYGMAIVYLHIPSLNIYICSKFVSGNFGIFIS